MKTKVNIQEESKPFAVEEEDSWVAPWPYATCCQHVGGHRAPYGAPQQLGWALGHSFTSDAQPGTFSAAAPERYGRVCPGCSTCISEQFYRQHARREPRCSPALVREVSVRHAKEASKAPRFASVWKCEDAAQNGEERPLGVFELESKDLIKENT